ncbi:hypothetical protein EMIHUDRAFT_212079 [Emiliania huxleyi CCMP1516]|uniref:Uncharacterized protein n=2 Tax=Emiliania huxleyi TaxID=2903 RepID=A0A0D3IS58_EMIH1|nr:hypothetical protein EMIHUDRAFT_212079 [Emiliania huxleyi CCMP1516]EOD14093.1 hypothetical protein EMIHUDRAFT_212079 [Emiliania huxleyi CCMP1516]|eukprot:XP_005766522.1 hypothetical protein EMIHUDRAFT_212079 [Emiliania huxleyi CCMP1516]
MVCPLDLALTGTAWARFLNELLTCGLLDAAPFSSSAALQLAIDRLDVSPAALEDYVLALEGALPPSLCAPNVAGPQWLEEARDAATYLRGDAGRRSVEDKRLYLLAPAPRYCPQSLATAPTTPLATAVRRVEASLAPRRAVLAAASANGASPQSVVAALVEHAASLRSPSAVAATDTAPSSPQIPDQPKVMALKFQPASVMAL